jgi:hypothetical protein
MLILVIVFGLLVYVVFCWNPRFETETASEEGHEDERMHVALPPRGAPFIFEHSQYGFGFRGYHDEYCFSTPRTFNECVECVRNFFPGRKAKLKSQEKQRLIFSRGTRIFEYLGGSDTWPTQEIDISFEAERESTKIFLQYRVAGWLIRFGPNQLRREVLDLQTCLLASTLTVNEHAVSNLNP